MAQIAFCAVLTAGSLYFYFRRRIDPFTVAFAGSAIYFIPGLFGFARFSYGGGTGEYFEPMAPAASAAMLIVLSTLLVGAIAFDRLAIVGSAISLSRIAPYVPITLLAIVAVSGTISLFSVGRSYFCLDKNIVIAHLDRWYFYAVLTLPLCFTGAIALRQKTIAIICIVLLLADLFVGFRNNLAVTIIAGLTMVGHWFFQGSGRTIRYLSIVLACGGALFVVKQYSYALKYSTASVCETKTVAPEPGISVSVPALLPSQEPRRPTVGNFYTWFFANVDNSLLVTNSFTYSEPFLTAAILNETVRQGFRTSPDLIERQILASVPGAKTLFGITTSDVPTFDSLFQPALFPRAIGFGMANNPWAQAYAAGGLLLVALFAVVHTVTVALLSFGFWRTEGPLRGFFAVLGAWTGFYFHRNDLLTQMGTLKHVVYIMAFALAVSLLVATLKRIGTTASVAIDG